MFSNGMEYIEFMEKNCELCKKYTQELSKICPIDSKIYISKFEGSKVFPYDKLKPVGYMCRYICKEIELKDEYKHLEETFKKELMSDK